jgi:small subunit ribosomal protein S6
LALFAPIIITFYNQILVMRSYETTFIVDPVLSGDDLTAAAHGYVEWLKNNGCTIVNVDEMGLRQMAYPIKKRHSAYYFCIEVQSERGEFINKFELALRRDERILRFLTCALDKNGVKYNADKRSGLIGKRKRDAAAAKAAAEAAAAAETETV